MKTATLSFTLIFAISCAGGGAQSQSGNSGNSQSGNSGNTGSTKYFYTTTAVAAIGAATSTTGIVVSSSTTTDKIRNRDTAMDFAVKCHDKILRDDQRGSGAHFASMVLLVEKEGMPKDEAEALIKAALKKAGGNALSFGIEIRKSMENFASDG